MSDARGAYSWACSVCGDVLRSTAGQTLEAFLIGVWNTHLLKHVGSGFDAGGAWLGCGSCVVPTAAAMALPGFAGPLSLNREGLFLAYPAYLEREGGWVK